MCNSPNHNDDGWDCQNFTGLTPELYKYWYEGNKIEYYDSMDLAWKSLVDPKQYPKINTVYFYRKALVPHVHANVIKAWADGATIEMRVNDAMPWGAVGKPAWHPEQQYRIKPD